MLVKSPPSTVVIAMFFHLLDDSHDLKKMKAIEGLACREGTRVLGNSSAQRIFLIVDELAEGSQAQHFPIIDDLELEESVGRSDAMLEGDR